jgi:hypothetical protein
MLLLSHAPTLVLELDKAPRDLTAVWDDGRSCQGEIRTRCRKRALTPPTHHPSPTDHTANVYQEGSNPLSASGKNGSDRQYTEWCGESESGILDWHVVVS